MKLQDLQSPYRELAEMRREKLKDTEFVKQWSDNFEEYGTLANAYDWTETPEGDEFWDLINQGKLPEIPASSLAELAEWQKSKGEKVEPTQNDIEKAAIEFANTKMKDYVGSSYQDREYLRQGFIEGANYQAAQELKTEPTLIGGKTDAEWLYLFAGQAMQGLLSNHDFAKTIADDWDDYVDRVSGGSIEQAKALLTKLKEVENV